MENTTTAVAAPRASKTRRRLRPEAVSRIVRAGRSNLADLYQKPVEQLTPSEIRQMKAAFLSDR